jgi:hypothetical protein
MTENLVLSEAEFDRFRRFCYEKGFDLSYYSPEISGTKEEIERHHFDNTKVIKLRKRRFGFEGIPYDVAEWQQESWQRSLPELRDMFFKKAEYVS